MSEFIVRVELENGTKADYEALDKIMVINDFMKTVERRGTHLLPTGEYLFLNPHKESFDDIGLFVMSLAEAIKPDPAILITKGSFAFIGLKKLP
jgi:hypothetical protein